MKNFCNTFFGSQKNGKILEKTMAFRLAITVSIITVCLFLMTFSAYAYFTSNITSPSNKIKTSEFKTKISVKHLSETNESTDINPTTIDSYSLTFTNLTPGECYTVTILPSETNTAKTGYVALSATGCDKIYHTQQLGADASAPEWQTSAITFKLMITDKTDVTLSSNWGTSVYYASLKATVNANDLYVTQNEEIKMVVNGFEEPNLPLKQPVPDTNNLKTDNQALENPSNNIIVSSLPSTSSKTESTVSNAVASTESNLSSNTESIVSDNATSSMHETSSQTESTVSNIVTSTESAVSSKTESTVSNVVTSSAPETPLKTESTTSNTVTSDKSNVSSKTESTTSDNSSSFESTSEESTSKEAEINSSSETESTSPTTEINN